MEQPVTLEILWRAIAAVAFVIASHFAWTARSRSKMHEDINDLKVQVARDYATNRSVKDMEDRIMEALKRIEHKVDGRLVTTGKTP